MSRRELQIAAFALRITLLGFPVLLATGCHSWDAYCEKLCACTGCLGMSQERCVYRFERIEETVSETDCSSPFGDYFACLEDEARCEDGDLVAEECEREEAELSVCQVENGLFGSP